MNLTSPMKRRMIVKGAAWSAPIIAASATIPAYAASPCTDGCKDLTWVDSDGITWPSGGTRQTGDRAHLSSVNGTNIYTNLVEQGYTKAFGYSSPPNGAVVGGGPVSFAPSATNAPTGYYIMSAWANPNNRVTYAGYFETNLVFPACPNATRTYTFDIVGISSRNYVDTPGGNPLEKGWSRSSSGYQDHVAILQGSTPVIPKSVSNATLVGTDVVAQTTEVDAPNSQGQATYIVTIPNVVDAANPDANIVRIRLSNDYRGTASTYPDQTIYISPFTCISSSIG